MSNFVCHGPLTPKNQIFQGREIELERLKKLSFGEIQSYIIVYGGRQTGKTSLLLRFLANTDPAISSCFVDFQGCPNANTQEAFQYIGQQISLQGNYPLPTTILSASDLISYLNLVASNSQIRNFIVMLEELGALPVTTRKDIANVIRSIFSSRNTSMSHKYLPKLSFILAGGIELYDLAATQVSTLFNICEAIYLSDLSIEHVQNIIAIGFSAQSDEDKAKLSFLTNKIFDGVNGHPYLTQRFGKMIAEESKISWPTITDKDVDETFEKVLKSDIILKSVTKTIQEQKLIESCVDLLKRQIPFSRIDDEMARLELIGVAKENQGHWDVRNRLFERSLLALIKKNHTPYGNVFS